MKNKWVTMGLMSLLASCLVVVGKADSVSGQGASFTEELFDQFITMRGGDGTDPIYWYATGEMRSFPEGDMIVLLEGLGADRLVRVEGESRVAHQLHREVFLHRHPDTGEVLREWEGRSIRPLKMPYQFYTYRLEGGELQIFAEQGSGQRLQKLGPVPVTVRRLGEGLNFSLPLFISGPNKAFAHYDFFVIPNGASDRYRLSWIRYDDWPRFPASGRRVMHAVSRRFERFEDLPATIRDFVEKEAPLYKMPPKDLEEIRELQKGN